MDRKPSQVKLTCRTPAGQSFTGVLSAALRLAKCLVLCAGEAAPPLGLQELPAPGRARSSGPSSSSTTQARPGRRATAARGSGSRRGRSAHRHLVATCGGGGAGLIQPRLTEDGLVCVDMGPPILDPERVPSPPPSFPQPCAASSFFVQAQHMLVQHPPPTHLCLCRQLPAAVGCWWWC